jgi:thiol-disulfide isomerase/thioredoxin
MAILEMKKHLFALLLIVLGASAAGGLYLYTIKADNEPESTQSVNENGEQVDEAKITEEPAVFINSGPAPEFAKLSGWLNTDKPLTIEELRGKVVLVNFWTYSCIDCTKAIPYIAKWNDTYKDKGLVIIGVHTPQFAFEKVAGNVSFAVKGQGVNYPVAQDNDYKTWTAYHNQFWPASYLIDQNGNIVYTQLGGGKYGKTEKAIRTLLGMEGDFKIPDAIGAGNPNQTPNIYTGTTKLDKSFGNDDETDTNEKVYVFPKKLAKNKFALEGTWKFNQESVIHTKGYGRMILNFNAAQLNMVASSPEPITVKVYIDDILIKGIVVRESGLYQLYDSLLPGEHTMRLEIPNDTLQIFSFTFA